MNRSTFHCHALRSGYRLFQLLSTRNLRRLFALTIAFTLASGLSLADNGEREKALLVPFTALEKAIRKSDEGMFKAQWHPDGLGQNLVGGSGIPGMGVYKQGTRKQWFLKPDLSKATVLGEGAAVIVPCEVWSWIEEKAVDHVDALVVKNDAGAYVLLGSGEKREQVEALAQRWLKKEPLAPPPSGDKKD